ncbi:heavy metal sensor histidine kinase [Rhodanobacter umsongensis]
MLRLSLSARLTTTFIVITVVCFGAVGYLQFKAVSKRIYEQDETNLVLSARHLRRLVAELDSTRDLVLHQDRLVATILGDAANAMRITDRNSHVLIDHNPSGYLIASLRPVPEDQRITLADIRSWNDAGGKEIRGVATTASLGNGTSVTITVARSLADRAALLSRYRRDTAVSLLAGMLVAVMLSYLLVYRALRPLRVMAENASAITAQRLSTRMPSGDAPAELHALAIALNDMLARLEEGFARVWQFTVDLAHDLRTPIGNLRGANEVALARSRSVAEYEALLGSNIEECDRVSRMIESVLFLARAESPQFALQRAVIDIEAELQRIADYFEGIASEAGVSIHIDARATVYADRDLFRRAVSNLLSNALRYTAPGEAINILAKKIDHGVYVTVENPGPGIDPEHLDKLFDRFYRIDRSRSDSAKSTGLGLSIVKSIMELHGGDVIVESHSNATTRFTLLFPRVTIPE